MKQPRVKFEKHKVSRVESNYLYGGLTNEMEYVLYVDSFKVITRKRFNVGDTITLKVYDVK